MPEGSSTSLAQILGAEIMRVGTWNGTKFTDQDLADIAAAASEMGYVPPLKVGHDESIGARAWGWIRNLRKEGEKLLGDLMDIPESLAAIIRERGYDQLSAEVYLDLDRNGKRFRRALKAVALLGGEVPAVSDLKPLRELFADAQTEYRLQYSDSSPYWDQVLHGYPARTLCFTSQPTEGGRTMPQDDHTPPKPDTEVARLREEAAALKAKADAQATQLAEQKASADAQAAELVTLKAQSEAQATELKAQKDRTVELEAKNREIALTAKLDAWKGPPAFRPFLEVYYRLASETPQIVKLSLEPGKSEEQSLEVATDKLAEMIATKSSWMFKQLSVVGGSDFQGDAKEAGEVIHERAQKMVADKGITYQEAKTAVLNADSALKQAYAGV